jgi:hypothetical protein
MRRIDEILKAAKVIQDDADALGMGRDAQPQRVPERVTLEQLDASWHPQVATAIKAAKAWASRKVAGWQRISLVLVASGVTRPDGTPDLDRTGYGVGKTHIARAVQWASYHFLEDGTPVAPAGRFYAAADLLERLGGGDTMYELAPAGTETVLGLVGGTPVLVIDDVGVEGVLPYVAKESQELERMARYFEVVNYCYTQNISVVITANMSLDRLAAHIGGRAWSRLQQMAPAGFMVDMTGVPDYRRRQGGR